MSSGMIIRTVLEFAAVVFTLWAVFHEDRFAAFERRMISLLRRRRMRVIRGGNNFSEQSFAKEYRRAKL